LLDPKFVAAESELRDLETAARAAGREIVVVKAPTEPEIEAAASLIAQSGAAGMVVGAGPFFIRHRRQLVALAARLAIPATYVQREFALDGGLMSYGASQTDAYRRAAGYVVRILKGEKPADMPVELPTRFEFVINLKTARTLGLSLPPGVPTDSNQPRTALACCDCSQPVLALPRHSKIADGLPLSEEQRSCNGHHYNDRA
jgi:putative ABC transport system substrate-binding protein